MVTMLLMAKMPCCADNCHTMQLPYCADSCHTVLTYAILRSFILYRQLSHCAHSCRALQSLCEEVTANMDSCQNCADNLCATKSQRACTNETVHYKLAPFVINFVPNSIRNAVVTKRLAMLPSVIRPCQKPCRHRATHWTESTTSTTSMGLGSDDLVTSKTRPLQNADGKNNYFFFLSTGVSFSSTNFPLLQKVIYWGQHRNIRSRVISPDYKSGYCCLTHLAPDRRSPPALFPYHETPDCPVAAG